MLDYRRREAEVLFRRIGITFAVYGEADAQERLIPFDVLPRILSAPEWDILRAGLEQRIKAINHYIRDVYHRRDVLKAGIVPEDLVFQNPVFRPEMNGQKVPHDIYVHIGGIDIVRVDAETFACRGQCPHAPGVPAGGKPEIMPGVSELFARHRVAPVENYVTSRRDADLTRPRPRADPTSCHPGVYNSAYYVILPRRQARHRVGRRPRKR